jgi:GNAT superfamily N-acetyltransferase
MHRLAFDVVPLQPHHVDAATALVAARYRRLRSAVPVLPAGWAAEPALARIIGELVARGAGAAAVRDGALIGFQGATLIDGHGGRWAYTPDVGHATSGLNARDAQRVVEALYAHLAAAWVRDTCLEHVITVFADDADAMAALARLGFGHSVIDLVRDLTPVADGVSATGVTVRRAGPDAAAALVELEQGLRSHLVAAPIFLRAGPVQPLELQRRTLGDPAVATFVAEVDGDVVAFLRAGPSAMDVATIVRDRETASVSGAFTIADRRGHGVATCLLDAAVGWAREAGYARIATDHESANGEAFRFCARHFTPVALSLSRRLAPRIGP